MSHRDCSQKSSARPHCVAEVKVVAVSIARPGTVPVVANSWTYYYNIMSTILETADTSCASCGIAEVDEIKLKTCDACDLVRYCSDNCQQDHSQQHEATCKERAAELRDEILFRQPESTHVGDCPICCLPLPIEIVCCKSKLQTCCSKVICKGCFYANDKNNLKKCNVCDLVK
eukprot:scaffold4525_cov75-Skeletonema_marinoi.AAC.3